MRLALVGQLDVHAPKLDLLRQSVISDYSAEGWGLGRFSAIADVIDRAVASDLLVSSLEGVSTALTAMGLRHKRYVALLGPNGRTMPGAHTTLDDHLEFAELDACTVDCFRAVGSALDCMAAAAVLMVGVPTSVQRAEGSWLLRLPRSTLSRLPTAQLAAWERISGSTVTEGDSPAEGWLAWAIETRNAVLHRGTLLRMWTNRPAGSSRQPKLILRTEEHPATLMRVEQHLRREPWIPDMHAIPGSRELSDMWIAESAQRTLRYVSEGMLRIVERVAGDLSELWAADLGFVWPHKAWGLRRRDDEWRAKSAARFRGFEPDYPTPSSSQVRLHPDSAVRAVLAERVRTAPQGGSQPD